MVDCIWWTLLTVAIAYWLWMFYGAIRISRSVVVLANQNPPALDEWPSVAVVVAGCNEGDRVRPSLESLLKSSYPRVEFIFVNDRSTDDTGEIMDDVARLDKRVRVIHITSLPDGWLGKVNALAHGASAAQSDWILFTDADVVHDPETLKKTIAWAERRGYDHMAVIPELWRSGWPLDAMISDFSRAFGIGMRLWAVDNPRSTAFIGVGAFNLVRRSAFERTPGFEWLRLEVGDDAGLGLMMKQSGAKSGVVDGSGLIGLHWYRNLKELAVGAEKAFASVGACSFSFMSAICIAIALLELSPWLAFAIPKWPWSYLLGCLMLLLWLSSQTILAWQIRRAVYLGWSTPISVLIGLAFGLRAAWLGWRRGGVVWRETFYTSSELRRHKRLWIGNLRRRKETS